MLSRGVQGCWWVCLVSSSKRGAAAVGSWWAAVYPLKWCFGRIEDNRKEVFASLASTIIFLSTLNRSRLD